MVALYRSHLLYAIQVSLPGFGGTTAALWALVSLSVQGEAGGGKRSKGQGGRRMKKLGGGVGESAQAPSASTLRTPQGQMDEDVQRILSQILQMQRLQAQGR